MLFLQLFFTVHCNLLYQMPALSRMASGHVPTDLSFGSPGTWLTTLPCGIYSQRSCGSCCKMLQRADFPSWHAGGSGTGHSSDGTAGAVC